MHRDEQRGDNSGDHPLAPTWLLIAALLFPTLLTWTYFVGLAETSVLQRGAYGLGKVVQFGVPAAWWWGSRAPGIPLRIPRIRDLVWGVLLGVVVGGAGLALWFGPIQDIGTLDRLAAVARSRAEGFGVTTRAAFLLLASAYSTVHAALEEAYWRGFTFGQLRGRLGNAPGILISSLAFAAHHMVLLGAAFGPGSPWTWALGTCVALGGAIWAWQYDALGSLWAPWVGHALIDAAIFVAIFDVLRPLPGG